MSLFRIVDQDAVGWIYSNIYLFYTIFVHIARGKTGINAIILPAD